MPVGLTYLPGKVPSLRWTSVELVTASLELNPVSWTLEHLWIGSCLQLKDCGICVDNVS